MRWGGQGAVIGFLVVVVVVVVVAAVAVGVAVVAVVVFVLSRQIIVTTPHVAHGRNSQDLLKQPN